MKPFLQQYIKTDFLYFTKCNVLLHKWLTFHGHIYSRNFDPWTLTFKTCTRIQTQLLTHFNTICIYCKPSHEGDDEVQENQKFNFLSPQSHFPLARFEFWGTKDNKNKYLVFIFHQVVWHTIGMEIFSTSAGDDDDVGWRATTSVYCHSM